MPDPQRLLRTLERAKQDLLSTPGRRGRFLQLDNASDVMVVGDLHGNIENFRKTLLHANLARQPGRHLILQELIHGPHRYPGGGDKSHQLVDLTAALMSQYSNRVHFLLGNHELAQLSDQGIAKVDDDLNDQFRAGVDTAYGRHAEAIYAAYLELFGVALLAVRTANRVWISHSLPSEKRLSVFRLAAIEADGTEMAELQPGGGIHAMLWGRDTRTSTAAAFLKLVDSDCLITGHIPCDKGFDTPSERHLILDSMGATACYCLFPAQGPISFDRIQAGVGVLDAG